MAATAAEEFEEFVREVRPRLFRALAGCRGRNGAPDATAEALAYAWETWQTVREMGYPAGYLYRVGLSRKRARKRLVLPPPDRLGLSEVEPGLIPALLELTETQRTALWLVHACQWPCAEVADAMGTSVSMVGNHLRPGMERLRARFGGRHACLRSNSTFAATARRSASRSSTVTARTTPTSISSCPSGLTDMAGGGDFFCWRRVRRPPS
jgi:DNA-directed RNA polymerase specialized sigma24 family protein